MTDYWGYAGAPPASRIIEGTIKASDQTDGVQHYTEGCGGTTAFLQSVLRTINIPVEPVMVDGHTMPRFTTDDLYLSHGDDPYDLGSKCTPSFDAGLLLIDANTFNSWFSGVPSSTASKNVSRQPTMLSVKFLSDTLLHIYRLDILAGLDPRHGEVFHSLSDYYTFEELYPDLWTRLAQRLSEFGYASILFTDKPITLPGCRIDPIARLLSAWVARKMKRFDKKA